MAQTMLLGSGVSSTHLKTRTHEPLLQFQIQKIKPQSCSQLFFSPLSTPSSSSSSSSSSTSVVRIHALFKSKAKASPKKVVKPKRKVEDGIFGTSGGIGFTKENELFVGRVAMLGFAGNDAKEAEELEDQQAQKRALWWKTSMLALVLSLSPFCFSPDSSLAQDAAVVVQKGGSLFRQACIGCHDTGGNLIQPGATLFTSDLQKNGVETEEDIYKITYYGKGRMPGFGEMCTPRGQCTFGPRLQDEDIRILAQFVKLQADQGWPKVESYGD